MGAFTNAIELWKLSRRLRWSADQLAEFRRRRLRELLEHCYLRVPYYRELFSQMGAHPQDFQNPEDLARFPILEKQTLRQRWRDFVSDKAELSSLIKYRSSGSTGIPLELFYHPLERLQMGRTVTRELFYHGFKPWQRLVNITEPRHASPKNRWYHRLGFMQERFLSVYEATERNLERLNQLHPHALLGFPSVLVLIGRQMRAATRAPLRPRLLFTIAEVLTDEYRRDLCSTWGVDPIDLYGCNEMGHVAFQCQQRRGYHLNADALHVEIVVGGKRAVRGQRGELIVTNFDLRVMPLLRYRVGDVAQFSLGSCSCGCSFPLLEQIAGRSDGFIISAADEVYSALEISLLLKPVTGISQYRLLQQRVGELIVEWVAAAVEAQPEAEMERLLRERLGAQFQITLRRVSEIPRERSGKIRSVISALPSPFWERESDEVAAHL